MLSHLACPFGPMTCSNPYGLAFSCLSHSTGPGASRELQYWWKWERACVKCSLRVKRMEGIVCGNFSASGGSWPPCQSVWHAECYTFRGELPTFPTVAIKDKLGNPWHKDEKRHRRLSQGVDRSHMCIPFQCEICWMRNLEGRDPIMGSDDVFKACIKRANLDAILGKSPLTIGNHVRETRAVIKNAELINKTLSYYP